MMVAALGVIGLAWCVPADRLSQRLRLGLSVWLGLAVVAPAYAAVCAAAVLVARQWRVLHRVRRRDRAASADVAVLAGNLLIALTGGLTTRAALVAASRSVHPVLQDEVKAVLRAASSHGLARALWEFEGHNTRLFVVLARARSTGASVASAVAAFIEELRGHQREAVLSTARRLPVKLAVPLALLILPGFVVLTVGPSVVGSARRLFGPLVSLP